MDWYPLWNSLRIAAISCVLVFFAGIAAAYYAARLPRTVKGVLDVVLTLPMVLPPTVCGYFLLLVFGTRRPLGIWLAQFGVRFAMNWYGGVLTAAIMPAPSQGACIPDRAPQSWGSSQRRRTPGTG